MAESKPKTPPADNETQIEQDTAAAQKRAANYSEPEYTKPTSQLDLERRLEEQNKVQPASHLTALNPADQLDLDDESDDGFVGVDPIYRNYANDTEKPLQADEGAEAKAEELHWKSVYGEATEENEAVKENAAVVRSATDAEAADKVAKARSNK